MDAQEPITDDLIVVSFLLQKAAQDDKGFTPLQLNKLLYICHGWVLGFVGRPLFDNSDKQIQAWKYGPVVVNIYHKFKHFVRSPVTLNKFCDQMSAVVKMDYKDLLPSILDQLKRKHPDVYEILDWVYKNYGNYTGGQMVTITHKDGTPWKKVYGWSWTTRGNPIPDDLIKDYYKNRVERLVKGKKR